MVKSQSQSQTQRSQQEGYRVADEELNEDLLLHCRKLEQEQIKRTIDFNKEQGVKHPDGYIGYGYADGTTPPMQVKQKMRWWATVRHKRSKEYITTDSLLSAGVLSESEIELFKGQTLPRRELISLARVKTHDGSEFLMRQEQWIGLNSIGGVITISINGDIDYTHRVPIEPITVKQDEGIEVKALRVGSCEFSYGQLPRIYTTPFRRDNVLAALEKAQPYTDSNGVQGNIKYYLIREGTTNPTSVSSLQEFIDGNFDELWTRQTTPNPQININSKDLQTFVKMDRESRQEHKQYS